MYLDKTYKRVSTNDHQLCIINTNNDLFINGYFKHRNIKMISNGMCWNKDTFMYSFNNELYRVKTYQDYDIKPKLIHFVFDSCVKQIESGNYHTAFLTINGNVYGCINDIYWYTLGLPK